MSLLGIKWSSSSKKVEAFSKSRSSSSSIMYDAGLPSLFLLVNHYCSHSAHFSIIELNTPNLKLTRKLKVIKKTEVVERQNTIRFLEVPRGRLSPSWLFSTPTSSTEGLYMVVPSQGLKPLPGFKLNFTTESFVPIKTPLPSARYGHVFNLGGRIYFFAHDWYIDNKHNVFQCYDPEKNSWNSLIPFPRESARARCIVAIVAWCDTILFNVDHRKIWAYDVIGNKWYLVDVEGTRAFDIAGEAVVVGDTIYALTTESNNLVVELSIRRQQIERDLVFKCAIGSENLVPDLESFNYFSRTETSGSCCRNLVHLGKSIFCLVDSCDTRSESLNGYHDIQLIYIKLKGRRSRIVANFIHHVKVPPTGNLFEVILCFSLPKCKTPVLKDGKIFKVDRFPDENESTPVQAEAEKDLKLGNDSSQANIIYPPDPCSSFSGENGFEKHGKVAAMESQGSGLDNDVKEQLDFLKEQAVQLKSKNVMLERSKSSFGAREAIGVPSELESSVYEVVDNRTTKVMSPEVDLLRSALDSEDQKTAVLEEKGHVSLFESELEELKIRKSVETSFGSALVRWKQASSDQRKSEGTGGVLEEEDQVFESGLKEYLKTQKSVEAAMYDSAVNEIKKLQLELQAMAESEAAEIEQAELFKRELNRLRKEMEAQDGAFKRELNSLKREMEVLAPRVGG